MPLKLRKQPRAIVKRRKMLRRKRRIGLTNTALNPIPQRFIVRMKYSDTFTLSTSSLSPLGVYRFNLNSIYDPNRTGTGHQPYAHDTFQALYNRYRVIKCSYRIAGASNNASAAVRLAALPANEEVIVSNVSEAVEHPKCKYINQGFGAPQSTLKGIVYLPSLVGRTKAQYMADDRYQAIFGASPNESAILNIYGGFLADSLVENTIQCNIELTYTVECFDYRNLAQS